MFGSMTSCNVTVNDLIIDGAVITDATEKDGYVGVFGNDAASINGSAFTFNNVHVKANVTSTNYAGGFVAYVGNSESSSSATPQNVLAVNGCSFEGTVTGGGSVGAIVGHEVCIINVTGFEVKQGSVIECTEDRGTSARKAGALFGTIQGPVTVSGIVNNGEVVNVNGAANADDTNLYGRISGGSFTNLDA